MQPCSLELTDQQTHYHKRFHYHAETQFFLLCIADTYSHLETLWRVLQFATARKFGRGNQRRENLDPVQAAFADHSSLAVRPLSTDLEPLASRFLYSKRMQPPLRITWTLSQSLARDSEFASRHPYQGPNTQYKGT